ncbi:MAG TPA: UpxY family transcription antiterminator [Terriglobia bacterium]|nr:UpxY family transcription antiterminator [Terriglobia bacterium]
MHRADDRRLGLEGQDTSLDPVEAVLEPAWYAIHTSHQHEKSVSSLLTQKGFDVFLPLYRAAHRWKDRTQQVSLPLFPGYLFLHGGFDRRLAVLTTPGIHGLVSFGQRPAPIPQSEIDAVRRMVAGNAHCEPHPFLKCGDWIRVKSGPLVGLEGILVRKKNLFRLVLSVELLQQSVAVEVDAHLVERVARPPVLRTPGWMRASAFGFASRGLHSARRRQAPPSQ